MTVQELISLLEAYDPESEVVLYDADYGFWAVEEVWRSDDGKVMIR